MKVMKTPHNALTKVCTKCSDEKPATADYFGYTKLNTFQSWCRDCMNEYLRNYHFISRFGITREERNNLIRQQNGLCAICQRKKKLGVDHNHKTKSIRGMLCNSCNAWIANIREDLKLVKRAYKYLQKDQIGTVDVST